MAEAGSALEIDDRRADGTSQQFVLTGTLRDDQADAVADVADHDFGVLVAAPGVGKTVIACALIGWPRDARLDPAHRRRTRCGRRRSSRPRRRPRPAH